MIVVRDEIEEIVMAIQSSDAVTSFLDNLDGTYTIGTNDIQALEAGYKVVLQYSDTTLNRDIIIDSILGNTFTFTDTNVTQPETWEMALYFECDHRIELNKKYTNKAKAENKRVQEYPLFWLYADFIEVPGNGSAIFFETTLQAAIVDFSERNLYAEQRIEQKFKPVLYKYKELIEIAFNTAPFKRKFTIPFGENNKIQFQKIDRPFFGSADQNQNVLPQVTDAIEIEVNLKWRDLCLEC